MSLLVLKKTQSSPHWRLAKQESMLGCLCSYRRQRGGACLHAGMVAENALQWTFDRWPGSLPKAGDDSYFRRKPHLRPVLLVALYSVLQQPGDTRSLVHRPETLPDGLSFATTEECPYVIIAQARLRKKCGPTGYTRAASLKDMTYLREDEEGWSAYP